MPPGKVAHEREAKRHRRVDVRTGDVANGVNHLKRTDNAQLIITHYQRLLDYVVPDHVHVLHNGRIVKSGGKELALELEEKGYDWVSNEKLQTA